MKVFGLKAIKKNKILVGLVVSIMLAMTAGSFALSGMKTSVRLQTDTTPSMALRSAASDFIVEGGTYGENEDYHCSYTTLSIHPQSSETTITIKNTSPEETTSYIEIAPIDGGI